MNASLLTADRPTHLKIATLAAIVCVAFVMVGMSARTMPDGRSSARQMTQLVVVRPNSAKILRVTVVDDSHLSAPALLSEN